MTTQVKFHVSKRGKAERCVASVIEKCPRRESDGSYATHYKSRAEAQKAAEDKMAFEYGEVNTNTLRKDFKVSRVKRSDDPPIKDESYRPHEDLEDEKVDFFHRFVPNNEDPNMRHKDNPDQRYLGAQERSIRMSEGKPPEMKSPTDSIAKSEIVDKRTGDIVKITQDRKGRLHDYNNFAYEDNIMQVRYYKGIVHADEEYDGPAVVFKNDGGEMYLKYGLLHRVNGPAVKTKHEVEFWRHGLRHRTGAPAVIRSNGEMEFWDRGEHIRTVYPEAPKPPEHIKRDSDRWWEDEENLRREEYEQDNYLS